MSVVVDLLFSSDGVVKMSAFGLIGFVVFVLFGPAPVDERQLQLDLEWERHDKRGAIFQQYRDTLGLTAPKKKKKTEANHVDSSSIKEKDV